MGKDVIVHVDHVSKKYCKSLRTSMRYGMQDIGRNLLGQRSRAERLRPQEFWALDDVSFEVKQGETVGIIGPNGSGKTTMLKLLNGIFWPDRGKITVRGKMGVLIELGAGFHPSLTGRENVYINAAILGMTKNETDDRFDAIVDFADIGDFIDSPVKYYSSGMFVRLGFAVAVHCDPDLLLIDEVLAVGDVQFQVKCYRKLAAFREMGKTLFLVSHDMGAIQRQTEKVILLHKGAIRCFDSPGNAINQYLALMSSVSEKRESGVKRPAAESDAIQSFGTRRSSGENIEDDSCPLRANYNRNEYRYGNGGARIIDFEIRNEEGAEIRQVKSLETMRLRVKVKFYEDVDKPIYGLTVKTKDGVELYGTNTLVKDLEFQPEHRGAERWVEYRIRFNLQPEDYLLSAGVAEWAETDILPLDRRYDLISLSALPADKSFGIVNLDADITLDKT